MTARVEDLMAKLQASLDAAKNRRGVQAPACQVSAAPVERGPGLPGPEGAGDDGPRVHPPTTAPPLAPAVTPAVITGEGAAVVVPPPTVSGPNPVFEAMVRSRATLLCLAGHHSDAAGTAWPCVLHLSEARRSLFDEFQRQEAV